MKSAPVVTWPPNSSVFDIARPPMVAAPVGVN
jgi:hypothetical protein